MPLGNSLRTLEKTISIDQLKDHVGALLYSLGYISHDELITKLEFGDLKVGVPKGELPIKFTIKKEKEVFISKRNAS